MIQTKLREMLMKRGCTTRETEVVELVCRGLSNASIGRMLFITERTVAFHLTGIYDKTGVRDRSQLILFAYPYLIPELQGTHKSGVYIIDESGTLPKGMKCKP